MRAPVRALRFILLSFIDRFRCRRSLLDQRLLAGSVAVYRAPADFVVSADGTACHPSPNRNASRPSDRRPRRPRLFRCGHAERRWSPARWQDRSAQAPIADRVNHGPPGLRRLDREPRRRGTDQAILDRTTQGGAYGAALATSSSEHGFATARHR